MLSISVNTVEYQTSVYEMARLLNVCNCDQPRVLKELACRLSYRYFDANFASQYREGGCRIIHENNFVLEYVVTQ